MKEHAWRRHHHQQQQIPLPRWQTRTITSKSFKTILFLLVVLKAALTVVVCTVMPSTCSSSSCLFVQGFQVIRPTPSQYPRPLQPQGSLLLITFSSEDSRVTNRPRLPPLYSSSKTWAILSSSSRTTTTTTTTTALYSSTGGGGIQDGPPGGGGNGGGKNNNEKWSDDFFREQESENLQKAREYMSEYALPLSYTKDENVNKNSERANMKDVSIDDEDDDMVTPDDDNDEKKETPTTPSSSSSALVLGVEDSSSSSLVASNKETLEQQQQGNINNNPYMAVVSSLSPSELIAKFSSSAHPSVQNAVRSTILSLIGGLPKMAFDTTTITTGKRLASLMFQLQMTGYMFKNAEYRLSLQQSLGLQASDVGGVGNPRPLLAGGDHGEHDDDHDDEDRFDPLKGKIRGKLRISLSGGIEDDDDAAAAKSVVQREKNQQPLEMQVDAAAYMSELRSEVSMLRQELYKSRQEQEEVLRKDLLQYIRTLPEQELRQLTSTISQDVLVAMKGLVNAVMQGIGDAAAAANASNNNDASEETTQITIGPDTITEQSGEAMAQLCMWQLVVGYNLRTLEVREEMKKSLLSGNSSSGVNTSSRSSSRSSRSSSSVEIDETDDDFGTFE